MASQKWPAILVNIEKEGRLFFVVYREVMRVHMALKAIGIFTMQSFGMRFAMTILAKGNLPVRSVT